jgi:malate dehydrogenase (oxaloacetate-decarboxylating)(NADP+)
MLLDLNNLTLTLTLCVQSLLKDPLYMGLRIKRTRGKEYDDLIDEFMSSCVKRYNQSINYSIDRSIK